MVPRVSIDQIGCDQLTNSEVRIGKLNNFLINLVFKVKLAIILILKVLNNYTNIAVPLV